ncbi:hypothetical protein [Entomobacter blattae]|nr:hypothetical protein [Entomobacter blattae]
MEKLLNNKGDAAQKEQLKQESREENEAYSPLFSPLAGWSW